MAKPKHIVLLFYQNFLRLCQFITKKYDVIIQKGSTGFVSLKSKLKLRERFPSIKFWNSKEVDQRFEDQLIWFATNIQEILKRYQKNIIKFVLDLQKLFQSFLQRLNRNNNSNSNNNNPRRKKRNSSSNRHEERLKRLEELNQLNANPNNNLSTRFIKRIGKYVGKLLVILRKFFANGKYATITLISFLYKSLKSCQNFLRRMIQIGVVKKKKRILISFFSIILLLFMKRSLIMNTVVKDNLPTILQSSTTLKKESTSDNAAKIQIKAAYNTQNINNKIPEINDESPEKIPCEGGIEKEDQDQVKNIDEDIILSNEEPNLNEKLIEEVEDKEGVKLDSTASDTIIEEDKEEEEKPLE